MQQNEFSVRRIVTGVDDDGKSIIAEDGPSPHVTYISENGEFALVDLWRTSAAPSQARAVDKVTRPAVLSPDPGGSVVRVLRMPPFADMEANSPGDGFDPSAKSAFENQDKSIHPGMHKTNSVDYAIILSGEVWAILERGETRMCAGDVLIQRATSHAWENRSDQSCVIAFVLVDAEDR